MQNGADNGAYNKRRTGALSRACCGIFAITSALLFFTSEAEAHEKWFYEGDHPALEWSSFLTEYCLSGVAVALLLTLLARFWWRARNGRDLLPGAEAFGATPEGRTQFYALVPLILGIHLGVPLIILGIQGELFSPNNQLTGGWIYWLGVAQIWLGLSFFYGGLTRFSAVLLAIIWTLGIFVVGLEPMLENLHYLGFALFFFLAGRGRYSIDHLLFPKFGPSPELVRHAMPILRFATGAGLCAVALTEKLANPALALSFLKQFPLNFTGELGMLLGDELFIWLAGTSELAIGLFLAFGIFPRTLIVTIWLLINMTLTVFSWVELTGHLPLYGVMAVLLIWTPGDEDAQFWLAGVLPKTRK